MLSGVLILPWQTDCHNTWTSTGASIENPIYTLIKEYTLNYRGRNIMVSRNIPQLRYIGFSGIIGSLELAPAVPQPIACPPSSGPVGSIEAVRSLPGFSHP